MPGIGLNPSGCCCTSYTCAVSVFLTFPCGTNSYSGRIAVSGGSLPSPVTATPAGSPARWNFLVPSAGTYLFETLDALPLGYDPISQTKAVACGGTYSFAATISAGYMCPPCGGPSVTGFAGPIPTTLTMTDSYHGPCLITYDPSAGWYVGTKTGSIPDASGCGIPCAAHDVTLTYKLQKITGTSSCTFGISAPSTTDCPGGTFGMGPLQFTGTNSPFFLTGTRTAFCSDTSGDYLTGLYGDLGVGGLSITQTVSA